MKEILEQIEVRFDPQERLAEIDKDRNMKNRIRGQVMYLNPPVVKKAPEEIRNGKTKAPKNIRKENNRFISLVRKRFLLGSTPIDHAPGLKKIFSHKIQKMRVGTLTRLPPVDLRLANGSVVHLPLRSRSLRRHKNHSLLLHARGLAMASFSRHSEAKLDEFFGCG